MRASYAAIATLMTSVAYCQSVADLVGQIPSCAVTCLATAATSVRCGFSDYACQCGPAKDAIAKSTTPCVASACAADDAASMSTPLSLDLPNHILDSNLSFQRPYPLAPRYAQQQQQQQQWQALPAPWDPRMTLLSLLPPLELLVPHLPLLQLPLALLRALAMLVSRCRLFPSLRVLLSLLRSLCEKEIAGGPIRLPQCSYGCLLEFKSNLAEHILAVATSLSVAWLTGSSAVRDPIIEPKYIMLL
jgi:hypothetical protein